MKNPREVITNPDQPAAMYKLPTYLITDDGIVDGRGTSIIFCKGNKEDKNYYRQEGVFTETLLETCRQYLTEVNVGEMASRETSMAITKIDEALMWINKRAEDRKLRGVQATYQK